MGHTLQLTSPITDDSVLRAALTKVILLEVISTSEISLVAKPIKEIFTVYFLDLLVLWYTYHQNQPLHPQ